MTPTISVQPPPQHPAGGTGSEGGDVVPVVVSRRSRTQLHCRSHAIFRLWREGTDPAPRGRGGWQEAGWQSGDTA